MRFLLMFLLLSCVCQAAPRVFIGSVQYKGPVDVEEHVVRVDVEELATAVGWVVDHDQATWHLHKPAETATGQDPGLYVGTRHFEGAIKQDGAHLLVPLIDLATFMGGHATFDESLQLVQCSIPGMPYRDSQADVAALKNQLSLAPYTLIYFYLATDPYCKPYGPIVDQYAHQHTGTLRLVAIDLAHQGPNWIFDLYKADAAIPEVVLVKSNGAVLQRLVGETTVATLEKELTPLMK